MTHAQPDQQGPRTEREAAELHYGRPPAGGDLPAGPDDDAPTPF